MLSILIVFVFLSVIVSGKSNLRGKVRDDVLDCADYDPKLIKLVTFDVFAALMDLNCK